MLLDSETDKNNFKNSKETNDDNTRLNRVAS